MDELKACGNCDRLDGIEMEYNPISKNEKRYSCACGVASPWMITEGLAIKAWNTRTESAEVKKLREACIDAKEALKYRLDDASVCALRLINKALEKSICEKYGCDEDN